MAQPRWNTSQPDWLHILVKKRFRSCIKTARTRTFPGADVVNDLDMVMMTFQKWLKNSRKPTQPEIRFNLEKLNDPTVMSAFQATINDRFATSCYAVRWRCWSGPHGHPFQQGSNWNCSWTSWQATPEEEALGYLWDPWSLWPKTREASQKEPNTIERLK